MQDAPHHSASDIPRGNWLDRFAPPVTRPYARLMRLDRPIGTWLLLLPGWWALAIPMPDGAWPSILWVALFGIGAILMRGAGCVINDFFDRDFDARVARTADRPLASGAVSLRAALVFLAALLAVSLAILLQFNGFAIAVGALSLLLVVPYPLMKRITWWPQAWLGLTFNWGALVGWTAVTGELAWPAIALYAAGVLWTLGYDTIYAHQDKEDDILIGVKSTALRLGDATKPWLFGFYITAMVLIIYAGVLAQLPAIYFWALIPCGVHLLWQAWRVNINDPADCMAKFRSNRDFGFLLLAAILIRWAF